MINYTDLVDYLITVAGRNPNLNYIKFGSDTESINDPNFDTPAFIISPSQSNFPNYENNNSFIQYGFQILFLDKMRQQEDNYPDILEQGLQLINSYLQVVDLKYKINWGFGIEPFIYNYDGGIISGQQTSILIEEIYNIDRFKSPFYNEND
jgi:hypothetical protein